MPYGISVADESHGVVGVCLAIVIASAHLSQEPRESEPHFYPMRSNSLVLVDFFLLGRSGRFPLYTIYSTNTDVLIVEWLQKHIGSSIRQNIRIPGITKYQIKMKKFRQRSWSSNVTMPQASILGIREILLQALL